MSEPSKQPEFDEPVDDRDRFVGSLIMAATKSYVDARCYLETGDFANDRAFLREAGLDEGGNPFIYGYE